MSPRPGDTATIAGAYGGNQWRSRVVIDRVVEVGSGWPLVLAGGVVFMRRDEPGSVYSGGAASGSPLVLLLDAPGIVPP